MFSGRGQNILNPGIDNPGLKMPILTYMAGKMPHAAGICSETGDPEMLQKRRLKVAYGVPVRLSMPVDIPNWSLLSSR